MPRKYNYRRKLPHKQWEDKVYFITFSTHHREVLTPGSRDIVLNTCLIGNGKLFDLHAMVVMPDHVHLLLTPGADENGTVSIPEIMQAIKSTSAHDNNKYLGRKGQSMAGRIVRSGDAGSRQHKKQNGVRPGKPSSGWSRG